MYCGAKNPQEFIHKLQKKIKRDPPEVNISEIVDQYYNREPFCGYSPLSNKLIFRKTLNRENNEAFDLKKSKPEPDTPIFKLTSDSFPQTSLKKIKEEGTKEAPMKMFSLHRYKLSQM